LPDDLPQHLHYIDYLSLPVKESEMSAPTTPASVPTSEEGSNAHNTSIDHSQSEDETEVEVDVVKGEGADRKRLFSKELRCMMYGFGDDQNPYTESVDFIEDIVIEYITEVTQKAMETGKTGRVQVEDIMHLVRRDTRKYARVKDLLTMNEELKKARKAFDEVKYATGV